MRITLRAVRKGACDYEQVKKLYLRSFPAAERAPFPQLMHWSDGHRAQMYALYAESVCVDGKCGESACADGKCAENACAGGKCAESACADEKCGESACAEGKCDESERAGRKENGSKCADENTGETGAGGEWMGLAYFVRYQDIIYLFYLAIDESKQGKGYGSALLTAVRRHFIGKRVILNIEALDDQAPNYEERVKRKRFYEKNGFHGMGYTVKELGIVYEMLGMGENVSKNEYIALMRSIIGRFSTWYVYHGQEEK